MCRICNRKPRDRAENDGGEAQEPGGEGNEQGLVQDITDDGFEDGEMVRVGRGIGKEDTRRKYEEWRNRGKRIWRV